MVLSEGRRIMTKQDWIESQGGTCGAIAAENAILSVGREFLSREARKVLAGDVLTLAEESVYYDFLAEQELP
jgi:hypothetical protein